MARLPSAGASHPGVIQVGGNGAAADLHEHPLFARPAASHSRPDPNRNQRTVSKSGLFL